MRCLSIFTLFFVLLLSSNLYSQQTISGYVTDESSGEPLFGAMIFDTISKKGATANEYGFYSLTIPDHQGVLRFSYYGFQSQFILLDGTKTEINVALGTSVKEIEEIVVNASDARKSTEQTNAGTFELSLDKVEKLPVLLGEKDVIKTLQLMPGVSSGGEGSSGLYVRGGGPDQNLILLDGVPIYNASHLFGFFSVFNNDALSKVTMVKGGFPARYGGRTSSVLDMRMKEGNLKKYNVEGSVGLISSKILVEGPIKKDKTGFIVSARRTYADLLAKPFLANQDNSGGYYFYDMNAKVHHKFNNKHHLYLSGYFGKDVASFKNKDTYENEENSYYNENKSGLGWGNAIGALRWNYRIGSKLFMNTTVTYSQYQFEIGNDTRSTTVTPTSTTEQVFQVKYLSNIVDWAGKSDFIWIPGNKHYIKFGAGDTYHTFKPGVFSATEETEGQVNNLVPSSNSVEFAHEAFAYIENDQKINNRLKINYGLHFSTFFVGKKNYNALQPRISGNTILTENSSLKFSYARTAQFIHLLSNTSIGLPTDLWVPATEKIPPILANQVSLGYNQLFGEKYNLVVEGYYKTMANLIQYKEGVSFIGNSEDWQNKVEVGRGWSYGGEIFLEKKKGTFTGWVGYTLSWTERQFDNINEGKPFPFTYDRRHDLSIAATYEFNDEWDLGAVFVLSSGRAVSLPTQQYSVAGNPVVGIGNSFYQGQINYLSSINGYRMPMYHRLDIGLNHTVQKKWGESIWSFSIYNVYNRLNAFFLFSEPNLNGGQTLNQVALFPIIPSVSWKFKLTELNSKK